MDVYLSIINSASDQQRHWDGVRYPEVWDVST